MRTKKNKAILFHALDLWQRLVPEIGELLARARA